MKLHEIFESVRLDEISRRGFLKGLIGAGAGASLGLNTRQANAGNIDTSISFEELNTYSKDELLNAHTDTIMDELNSLLYDARDPDYADQLKRSAEKTQKIIERLLLRKYKITPDQIPSFHAPGTRTKAELDALRARALNSDYQR